MVDHDKRKQSLYFPEQMLKEMQKEALRLDRSLSWIAQQTWRIAHKQLSKYPAMNELPSDEDERGKKE